MGIFGKQVINEVYFGNTSEMKALQDLLSKLRTDTIQNDTLFSKKGNTSKYLYEFNRKCEDIFGFKTFSLNIIYKDEVNAFTFGLGGSLDVWDTDKYFKPTKHGMKFDKSANYNCICFIYSGMFKDPKFTDREIMAIILHEIGHNFTSSMHRTSRNLSNIKKGINIANMITAIIEEFINNPSSAISMIPIMAVVSSNKLLGGLYKIREEVIRQNPKIFQFSDAIQSILNNTIGLASLLQFLGKIITKGPEFFINNYVLFNVLKKYNPIKLFRAFLGYNDEKLSDSFATMYGYGPEIASGLMKMEYTPKTNMKIIEALQVVIYLPIEILTIPCDEHPTGVTRAVTQIKFLEDELLSETTDPEMKKQIQSDIKSIQNELEDLRKNKNNYSSKVNYKIISKWYSLVLYDLFGGDIRELFSKENNNAEISKNYYSKLKDIKLK